jgi:ATP-dependent Lon protease
MEIDTSNERAANAEKILRVFGRLAIDKRRLGLSQLQKRGLPAFVAEWVLDSIVPGAGPLTEEEATKVQAWASDRIPSSGEQEVIKYRLVQGETLKLLTPVQTEVRLRKGDSEIVAKLSLIGLEDVLIGNDLLESFPDLLKQGMWGVTELVNTSNGVAITNFRPMQATVNLGLYKAARSEFTLPEWRDLMLLSMGYNPGAFTEDEQLVILSRLLPLVEKNMHLMELAPKGTGKSYLYENINPRVRLVSGGNVSPAVLFVNNATGQWGLLARFAVVVLDEVQTLKFLQPEEVIGGLKGYLANGVLTRGGLHQTATDCSLVMLANIGLDEQQKPLRDLLVHELPEFLRETAFLDRLKGIIPGWQTQKLNSRSFADSVGLKADFFGDALLALRDDLSADQYAVSRIHFEGDRTYKRNQDAVRSIASGMMKILFPDGRATDAEFTRLCLKPAVQLRQLVWDQLYSLDGEYRQYERLIKCTLSRVDSVSRKEETPNVQDSSIRVS